MNTLFCCFILFSIVVYSLNPLEHPTKGDLKASLKSLKGKGSYQADACLDELLKEDVWRTLLSLKKKAPKASEIATEALLELFGRDDLFAAKSALDLVAVGIAAVLNRACPNLIKTAIESKDPRQIAETTVDLLCAAEYLKSSEEFDYTVSVDFMLELHKILEELLAAAFPKLNEKEKGALKGLKENNVNVVWNKWLMTIIIVGIVLLLIFSAIVSKKRNTRNNVK